MKSLYAWGAIAVDRAASTAGDVLLSRAMKQVGDVGELGGAMACCTVLAQRPAQP